VRGLEAGIREGIERAEPTSDDSGKTKDAYDELLDVVESLDALLSTVDLEKLPDVVDVEVLPELVDADGIADAIRARDPDPMLDLSNLDAVVNERRLWNSIDLLEFAKAKRRLDQELADVLGEGAPVGNGAGSEALADVREYTSSLRPDAKEMLIQQEAQAKVAVAREGVVDAHERLEQLYESNETRSRTAARKRSGRNPTAVSMLPPGPLPDSVSTRLSTVPPGVPRTKIDPLPRIYGRRWRSAGR